MAIVRPVVLTDCYDEEFQQNRPVTEETVRKLIQNMNMLRALMPVGIVKAYQVNLPLVPTPKTYLYAYCNGGEITDGDSPLNGAGPQYTPDMVGRYLRGGDSSTTTMNEAGGAATVDLTHTHTIGTTNMTRRAQDGGGGIRAATQGHNHTVPDDLTTPTALDMYHLKIGFYLKINQ